MVLVNYIKSHIITYPTPSNLSYFYSAGSLLGLMMVIQVVTGVLLATHYIPSIDVAFQTVIQMTRNVENGWFLRYLHANGASMLFILIYLHIGRGMYYRSYRNPRFFVWVIGVIIYLVLCLTAFLGYVLPWGQMSYWGATVITSIATAIPYIGDDLVEWIWGGFAINGSTLTRFYTLHFLLPFVILALSLVHILLLHAAGSSNPLLITSSTEIIKFFPYFYFKDLLAFLVMLFILIFMSLSYPNMFSHSDNYILANPMVTPTHIVPEWYFLPFYAILKTIPSKLGGAVFMVTAILALLYMPLVDNYPYSVIVYDTHWRIFFFLFVINFVGLGYLGTQLFLGTIATYAFWTTFFYFFYFYLLFTTNISYSTWWFNLTEISETSGEVVNNNNMINKNLEQLEKSFY